MIKIKNQVFDVGITKIDREAVWVENYNATAIDNSKIRSVAGIRYEYTITFDMKLLSSEQYTVLYETLTSPDDYIQMEFPYNQETISGEFSISNAKDSLSKVINGVNYWTGLQIKATSRRLIKEAK